MSKITSKCHISSLIKNQLYEEYISLPVLKPFRTYNNSSKAIWLISGAGILTGLVLLIILLSKVSQISRIEEYTNELNKEISSLLIKQNELNAKKQLMIDIIRGIKSDLDAKQIMYTDITNTNSQMKSKINELTQLRNLKTQMKSENKRETSNNYSNDLIKSIKEDNESKAIKRNGLKSIVTYLRYQLDKIYSGKQLNKRYKELGIDSVLVQNENQLNLLDLWIGKGVKMEYVLLYRGSENGLSPIAFHLSCDYKKSTLVLLKTEIGLIGGYTITQWEGWGAQTDQASFLFNMQNERKYDINPLNIEHAGFKDNQSFASFGNGDLNIGINVITSLFPQVYGTSYPPLELTKGKPKLDYTEIEVFHVLNRLRDS